MFTLLARLFSAVVTTLCVARNVGGPCLFLALTTFACIFSKTSACYAGGGPENVFLLVNSESQDSLTIANHYIALRKIPPANVFYIPYKGSKVVTSGKILREKILLPALQEIKRRKLTNQIDYFVYSSDFPYRIGLTADFPKEKFSKMLPPRGALTGLTFLQAFVTEKRKEVVNLKTNWYCMEPLHGVSISRGFRSRYRWAPGGRRTGEQGLTYMLSAMLGVTDGRGNSVDEVVRCLRSAKQADATHPEGTVYFMKHDGPRSKPRHDRFPAAAAELRRTGVAAKVQDGKFPSNKTSIIGLTSGTGYTNVMASGSRFLPGAYCDNLTSYGALFTFPKNPIDKKTGKKKKVHVCIADFIRLGAAAANGTVFEPYAIQQKFPLPTVQVHYANGCSIAESFYQSVSGPYQQLLVGDPLCQPWAKIPDVKIPEIKHRQLLRGQVELTPTVSKEKLTSIRYFELYVDGVRTHSCKPGKKLQLDTTPLQDGHHELRVVATDSTPIETQGRFIADVIVKNGRDAIGLNTKQKKISNKTPTLTLSVTTTIETPVDVFCNRRKLGSLPTGTGTLKVATDQLGAGPVKIYATSENLRSMPLQLDITH